MSLGSGLTNKRLFTASMKPLELFIDGARVWVNKMPRSYKYLRPIKFLFAKETVALTRQSVEDLALDDFCCDLKLEGFNRRVEVSVDKIVTGMDGKAVAAVVNTGTMNCPACLLKPTGLAIKSPDSCYAD